MVLVEFELGVGVGVPCRESRLATAASDGMVPDGISGAVQLETAAQGFFSTLL